MRIVSYNILDGGEGRADPLAEVILAQRPDIVVLIEADEPAVVERIAHRAKMDYIHARGGRKGAAILSRWTIHQTIDHAYLLSQSDAPKSFLEASIVTPEGIAWTIAAVHLTAKATEEAEQRREREVAVVLNQFAAYRNDGKPHLLAGDFNANAPQQKIDPEKCKPATREAWEKNGGAIPRRVVQTILDTGYVDSLGIDDPRASENAGSFSTLYPGQRVDYIFSYGIQPVKIRKAWIETDRLAKYASDHFPIGAEIES